MRLPFVSRRYARGAVAAATAGLRADLEAARAELADARIDLANARAARRKAETSLTQERKKQRAVASWRHTDDGRLARALRAVAALRAEAAVQRRVEHRLTNQLLDATGYQGDPLLPAARALLDLDPEDPK